jgi:phenazine biosynthesis protein PhzF family
MRECPFVTVDVFTEHRFRGNPLAVVLDGSGLTAEEMQRIAAEFGYSETTFLLPADDIGNTARVRIFTPTTEVPFAGHPNVGTAFVVGRLARIFGQSVGEALRFEEKAGLVTVTLRQSGDTVRGATIRAPQPLSLGAQVPVPLLARAASLSPRDVVADHHVPLFASVGLKFIVAELSDLDALGRAKPNVETLEEMCTTFAAEESDCPLFLYTRLGGEHIRARMFAPLDNVPEDPATGSASAALAALLTSLEPAPHGHFSYRVEQGVEMERTSHIHVTAEKRDGHVHTVDISGDCVEVMRGAISL